MKTGYMKHILLFIILICSSHLFGQKVEMYLFGGKNCKQCNEIESGIIKKVRVLYPSIVYKKITTDTIDGFKKLIQFEKMCGDKRDDYIKVFIGFFPKKVVCLSGTKEINKKLMNQARVLFQQNSIDPKKAKDSQVKSQ